MELHKISFNGVKPQEVYCRYIIRWVKIDFKIMYAGFLNLSQMN